MFVWCYSNTCGVYRYARIAQEYACKTDTLESRIAKLEYYIEHQPKELVVHIEENKK